MPEAGSFTDKPNLPSEKWLYAGRAEVSDAVSQIVDHWVMDLFEGNLGKAEQAYNKGNGNWCTVDHMAELVLGKGISAEVCFSSKYVSNYIFSSNCICIC